jgi:hypothetical protein
VPYVRRIGRSNRPTTSLLALLPRPSHCRELIKKITHFYSFLFLLPGRSALRLPYPRRGRTLPSLLPRTPSTAARLSPVRRASRPSHHAHRLLPSVARTSASGARSARRVRCPPSDPSPVLMALVLTRAAGAGC